MARQISVSNEVYELLLKRKGKKSFSQVIKESLCAEGKKQDVMRFAGAKATQKDHTKQKNCIDEIQNVFGGIITNIPTMQRSQVGNTVDTAGIALLTDNQYGQNEGDCLGDNGKVHATHTSLEHRVANNKGKYRRHYQYRYHGEGEAVEGFPEQW